MAKGQRWADGPFKLITTPRAILKGGKETNSSSTATDMALMHNCIIRGLNSIYNQAPHVSTRADKASFLQYIRAWCLCLVVHHQTEEEVCFPLLEEMTAQPGIMEANIAQHDAFQPGLEALTNYAEACLDYRETFNGEQVKSIIDGFGAVLSEHLTDEVATLEGLDRWEERIDWEVWTEKSREHAIAQPGQELAASMILTNMDVTYERGLHGKVWPPFPFYLCALIRWYMMPMNKELWKYSSCDGYGMPKELYL